MAKLTKEAFINRINDLSLDDEIKISLMEDITDSFDVEPISAEDAVKISGYDDIKLKYEELLARYKERFMTAVEEVIDDATEELEEKEVIDIKEI